MSAFHRKRSFPVGISEVRLCPLCGDRSTVYDSRPQEGKIMRMRECNRCRHRWKTYEVMAEEYERLVSERG